ncbi:hypothetical protein OUZ56_011834 [Daphnia magna]|uniref:Uncharacterized protein n=1 Tax=Daphnia magna TaxID=35525 RepID=A0ABQ9Z1A2_9CRUS|nr:hypothetical protein OUZ56_011834 [Daphnia magna]
MVERFFSDLEWVIVINISFNQGDKVANELKMWLIAKTKLPVLGSSSNKDFHSMLSSAKTSDQPSKTQSQDIISYNPSRAEKAQQQLTTMVRDRAKHTKTGRWQRKILNWLFGVSTTEELDKVNNQIAKLSNEITAIVHALETHTTVINDSLAKRQQTPSSGHVQHSTKN